MCGRKTPSIYLRAEFPSIKVYIQRVEHALVYASETEMINRVSTVYDTR